MNPSSKPTFLLSVGVALSALGLGILGIVSSGNGDLPDQRTELGSRNHSPSSTLSEPSHRKSVEPRAAESRSDPKIPALQEPLQGGFGKRVLAAKIRLERELEALPHTQAAFDFLAAILDDETKRGDPFDERRIRRILAPRFVAVWASIGEVDPSFAEQAIARLRHHLLFAEPDPYVTEAAIAALTGQILDANIVNGTEGFSISDHSKDYATLPLLPYVARDPETIRLLQMTARSMNARDGMRGLVNLDSDDARRALRDLLGDDTIPRWPLVWQDLTERLSERQFSAFSDAFAEALTAGRAVSRGIEVSNGLLKADHIPAEFAPSLLTAYRSYEGLPAESADFKTTLKMRDGEQPWILIENVREKIVRLAGKIHAATPTPASGTILTEAMFVPELSESALRAAAESADAQLLPRINAVLEQSSDAYTSDLARFALRRLDPTYFESSLAYDIYELQQKVNPRVPRPERLRLLEMIGQKSSELEALRPKR